MTGVPYLKEIHQISVHRFMKSSSKSTYKINLSTVCFPINITTTLDLLSFFLICLYFIIQSHLVNARRNREWNEKVSSKYSWQKESSGFKLDQKRVKGRLWWPSDPIVINIDPTGVVNISSLVLDCMWWKRESSEKQKNEFVPTEKQNYAFLANTQKRSESREWPQHPAGTYVKTNPFSMSIFTVTQGFTSSNLQQIPKLHAYFELAIKSYTYLMFYGAYIYFCILMGFIWYCCFYKAKKFYRKPKL